MNIINAENLTKSYTERKLLDKASFYLQEGEKVGVIGINGTGKSTLLKIIAGLEEPDEGQVTCANHIVVRYLPQNPVFDPEMTVLDSVLTQCVLNFVGSGRTERTDADAHAQEQKWSLESDAKSMMTRLGITDFTQKTGELSGGQRKRLALVAALLVPCDVLILDEPTNDLDTQTLAILEDYLDSYEGIVIVVSHDRYFLDRVVRRIFAFEGNGEIRQYEGGYTDYVNRLAEEGRKPGEPVEFQEAAGRNASAAEDAQETGGVTGTSGQNAAEQGDSRDTWKREKKLKFSYKEQREYETIEDDIANLEAKVEQLDADMAENATNSVKLGELLAEKEAAEQALEEKMERWEYLEELAAKIAGQE